MKKALQLQQPGIEGIGVAMANQAAGQLLQIVTPAITRLPEDKRKGVATELQAEVRKFQGEVAPILRASATKWAPSTLGTALEEKLTEDELKTLDRLARVAGQPQVSAALRRGAAGADAEDRRRNPAADRAQAQGARAVDDGQAQGGIGGAVRSCRARSPPTSPPKK